MNAWLSAFRPRTLPAAAAPVLVGAAHAWHYANVDGALYAFAWLPAVATLVSALLIQVGTNLANDYFDFRKGADTPDRKGPKRASASGAIDPTKVRNAAAIAFGLAALVGAYLIWVAGLPILVIGLASIASGYLYTAGPRPLGYIGLGDLWVFVFFGPVAVMGTVFVQAHDVFFDSTAIWVPAFFLGLMLGALATAILVVNNLRDRPTDAVVGKRTLAVRIGDKGSRIEYTLLVAFAYVMVVGSVGQHVEWRLLLPLASLPLAFPLLKTVWKDHADRSALNPALGGTARMLLVFAILECIALVLGA